jgi:hypothetical protein
MENVAACGRQEVTLMCRRDVAGLSYRLGFGLLVRWRCGMQSHDH